MWYERVLTETDELTSEESYRRRTKWEDKEYKLL